MKHSRGSMMRSERRVADARGTVLASLSLLACVAAAPYSARSSAASPARAVPADRIVRIALGTPAPIVLVGATGAWRMTGRAGNGYLASGGGGTAFRIEVARGRLLATDGRARVVDGGPLVLRPNAPGDLVTWEGRRYRGELRVSLAPGGLLQVVNVLPVEEYLRGVVPLEIGMRQPDERAAVEAQAIAARSYTLVRIGSVNAARPYDMVASVADQVYGGAEAERPLSDEAVRATRDLVLWFAGRVVSAPYSSTCGGSTADGAEVWRTADAPYLRRVSDQIPGTNRAYCEASPRFHWSATFTGEQIATLLARHLASASGSISSQTSASAAATRAAVRSPELTTVRSVEAGPSTPSGRVSVLVISTNRGPVTLRGNEIRYALRPVGGTAILQSTEFRIAPVIGSDGTIRQLTLTGEGYGHGVGMCQWGAIGRARAGLGVREILAAYYPGTTVAPAS